MSNSKKQSSFSKLWIWAKPYHGRFICSVVIAITGVACGMVPYFCTAGIIGQLLIGGRNISAYMLLCMGALAGYLSKVLLAAVSTRVSHTATYYTLRDLRKMLIAKLSSVPMGTILNTPSGQYKTTIVDRVEGMEPTLAHLLPEMTSNALVPTAILIYLLILDWRMALASLVTLVIGITVVILGMRSYPAKWAGAVEAGRKMANAIVEYIGGIEVVKAFSQSAGSYRRYADTVNYNANYYVDWMRENQKSMSVRVAVIPAVLVCVLPVGFIMWANGSLDVSTFLTVTILSLGITGPIMAAFTFVDDIAVLSTNVEEISSILEASELKRPDNPVELKNLGISLRNVSFSYENDGVQILHNVNLDIRPDTVTALVGPSGSGKSTIAKLIAGFWDVSKGEISIGGLDMRQIPLKQWTAQIAYVSQENYLFNKTVRENIRMGRRGATDVEIEAVAKAAGCDDFIRGLEHGYDTLVGSGGGHLSGGERQRIAIVRAMLKDAPIVILDEATASIDPENEALIQKAISALTAGKTLIIIAHRLSTIEAADNIAVIGNGQIVAQGRQDELLKTCPLYADMWAAHLGARDEA